MPLPKYEASFRRIYGKYKRRAKKNGIDFTIESQDFRNIAEQDCTYCGAKPTPSCKDHERLNGNWKYNGLDRIDNNRGYVYGNVQPCCSLCNKLKSNLEEKDFLDHIQTIVSLRGRIKEDNPPTSCCDSEKLD